MESDVAHKTELTVGEIGEDNSRDPNQYGEAYDSKPTSLISRGQKMSLVHFFDLVFTKARLNLKSEANRNYLSYVWWALEPLLYMSVFYLVFGVLLQRGGANFVAYLLVGLVPFQWFSKTVSHASNSIVSGRSLLSKIKITPLFFPLVGIAQSLGKQIFVFLMLFLFLTLYGLPPTVYWVSLIPIVLAQLLFVSAISCCVAMLIPFVRDLSYLVPTGIQFVMFSSGVFFSLERIPQEWRSLFFSNPMANLLYQYREVLLNASWPDWYSLAYIALGSLIMLAVIFYCSKLLDGQFARVVIE